MMHRSHVILLVGPKGSGKTTLGGLLGRELGLTFLRVEPIYLRVLRDNPAADPASLEPVGFGAILEAVNRSAELRPVVCIESTGAAGYFPEFLAQLRARHRVTLVRVSAPAETCVARVRRRDSADHIPVSDDRVREINRVVEGVNLPWDLEVDNSGERPVEEVAREIALALAEAGRS